MSELIVDSIKPDNSNSTLTIDGDLEIAGKLVQSKGTIVQMVCEQTNAAITGSEPIPFVNLKPTKEQGVEVITASITPQNQYNKLIIEGTINAVESANHSDHLITALFMNEEQEAIVSSTVEIYEDYNQHNDQINIVPIRYFMVAGTTDEIKFHLRAGCNGGAIYINHFNGERRLGETLYSTLSITEISC